MAKKKIKKNLTDADMLKAFMASQPEEGFEEKMLKKDSPSLVKRRVMESKKPATPSKDEFYREFLTEKIETQIGKTLLEIKMEYFREGVGDFAVQVRKDGKNIVLETIPKKK